ncbi:hypothetical protein C6497_00700 [Candidatus Poribacteria bacterium]|nr:MAG: hypothetical protein C6497_00700 [Candidatus Poribacteria bacterium]
MVQKSRIRVGAVSFLNTKPLIYPLLNGDIASDDILLSVEVPSRLATQLSNGELDVGLIPIVEYFRANSIGADYRIIPHIGIISRDAVLSIQLYSSVPIADIKSIALDTSSRSSIALLKILFAEKYNSLPTFTSCEPSIDPTKIDTDAVLLIGDAALKHLGATEYSIDLGTEWHDLTGLPFVYACWVARGEIELGNVPKLLLEAKEKGIKKIPEIVSIESKKLPFSESLCREYLERHIHYDLDESAIEGLKQFHRLAVKHEIVKPGSSLTFLDMSSL